MILRSHTFKRVTIIGIGLMGGSLGLAIKKHRIAKEVVGFSKKQASLTAAIKIKAIDSGFTDLEKAVRNADLVVLATPVSTIIKLFEKISPFLRRGCLVTDLGSAKADVVEAAEKILPFPKNFIGSHPLAGSEKQGVEYACDDLFKGAFCIMTPTKNTSQVAKGKVKHMWAKIGADVKLLHADEHDDILAYTSHLPHLLAFALMETVPKKHLSYASRGLKDATRLAASSPQMWNDICMVNSKNVLKSLDECVKHLFYLRKAITGQDEKSLMHHFSKAKEKRDSLG